MKLKSNKLTAIEVHYNDVDRLITEQFGRKVKTDDDLKLTPGTYRKIRVTGQLGEYDQVKIERFIAKVGSCSVWTLLNQLAASGVIETGEYFIAGSPRLVKR